ncbi:M4 family metallopeptidase [Dictyobacter arantiisoli]|uniref:Neutral metalloproteinase n=1 Tax=Dictyobacter arantiisoli TaxID=2014874 RepID=A0A5A5T571_9CHLR|nr:M4 family metallopeptidase [Dictyobacter arantiisoli]GCF06510.1 zinc metalloprotease [Dictyobacter arantiisoli]
MKLTTVQRYILPPHMLTALAQHGSPEQRAIALHMLGHDHSIRTVRMVQGLQVNHHHLSVQASINAEGALHRVIYDDHGTMDLPGECVRVEGQHAIGDVAANEAYDALGWTHALYLQVYGRNSINDAGQPLDASVHYGTQYNNAFWDGERMIFGDGDNQLFNRFTCAIDVIGHELTHGVTEDESHLAYVGQSGSLNESISDVFGSLVKQYSHQQTAEQADWLIGHGLFTDKIQGEALRSLKAPGTAYDDPLLGRDPQPAHMDHYMHTVEDNGGVHINSGIPNHVFYLVATRIGGFAWEKAGRIWYETLRDPGLRPTANFRMFARLTMANAERMFGSNSRELAAVHEAWTQVGVQIPAFAKEY